VPGFEGTQSLAGSSSSADDDDDDDAYGVGLVHVDGRKQSFDLTEASSCEALPFDAAAASLGIDRPGNGILPLDIPEGGSSDSSSSSPAGEKNEDAVMNAGSGADKSPAATAAGEDEEPEDFGEEPDDDFGAAADGSCGPQLPDGLVLLYPALNLSLAPSPSRAIHNFDPVLPIGIMCDNPAPLLAREPSS
jgi:hypothetical protein